MTLILKPFKVSLELTSIIVDNDSIIKAVDNLSPDNLQPYTFG